MYNVSDAVIEAYKADGVHKEFKINLNGVDYLNNKIVDSTFNLKQSILDGENFEAVGCIASSFSVDLRAQFSTKVRDSHIKVYVNAGNTGWIQIFDGYVDKCTKTANGWNRHIEAYDLFYKLSGQSGQAENNDTKTKYDCTEWFNEHGAISIGNLFSELCTKFSIPKRNGDPYLVNGNMNTNCGSVKKASSVSALDIIKAVMQINGCFGYITGDGYLSWKYLLMHSYDETGVLYPSAYLYPQTTLYPGEDPSQVQTKENATNFIGEYEHLEYQDFKMLPINKVIVRNYEKDEDAGSYGTEGENKYIIEGNILIKDASKERKDQFAQNVYDVISSNWYVPFAAELPGLPYIECGDEVNLWDFIEDYGHAHLQRFYVLSRTLTGGQHLKDSWAAEGNEYLHEFVTQGDTGNTDDLQDEIDQKPDVEDVEEMIEAASGLYKIVSIAMGDLPAKPDPKTLYCIQGECRLVEDLSL